MGATNKRFIVDGTEILEVLNNVVFADDVALIAVDQSQLSEMLQDLSQALKFVGYKLSPEKCAWCCTFPKVDDPDIVLDGEVIPFQSSLIVLGTTVGVTDSEAASLAVRIRKAQTIFWANARILMNRAMPLEL